MGGVDYLSVEDFLKAMRQKEAARPHVQLKVKRLHPAAKLPTRAHETDAGLDFYAADVKTIEPMGLVECRTGWAAEIPPGWCLVLMSRSGLARRGVFVEAGCIDSGYAGEIVVLLNTIDLGAIPRPGDKVAQALVVPVPSCEVIEADELTPTPRGANGFGSTGA